MSSAHLGAPRTARRSGVRLCLGALALLTGCSTATQASTTVYGTPTPGAYAVATPGPEVVATPTVTPGGYQLVAAGVPVSVQQPGVEAVVEAAGPELRAVDLSNQHAEGTLTVTARSTRGELLVRASDFLGLDQRQKPFPLRADAEQVTARPGQPAVLHLSATLAAGHTTLTWQPTGSPLITWDFVVELD